MYFILWIPCNKIELTNLESDYGQTSHIIKSLKTLNCSSDSIAQNVEQENTQKS